MPHIGARAVPELAENVLPVACHKVVLSRENMIKRIKNGGYTRGNDLSDSLESAGGIGGILARSSDYSGANPTVHNYYLADGNGNITYMLDGSQGMVASYRYDPFGNTISKSGTLADDNVYRLSSKELLLNSGMYYFGFRFYDPSLQRWINRDPIGESAGRNLYGFIGNDPIYRTDSWGLCKNGFSFFLNGAEILRTYHAPTYQPNISGYFTCGWSAVLEKRVRCYTCDKTGLSWHFEIEKTVERLRNSPSESHAYAEGQPEEVCKNFWANTKPPGD